MCRVMGLMQRAHLYRGTQSHTHTRTRARTHTYTPCHPTGLSGHYRDILVSMQALHAHQTHGAPPLLSPPTPLRPRPPKDNGLCSPTFPLTDVTKLPDNHPSVPQGSQSYDTRYMGRLTCWTQTQPSHIETSTHLRTGISLFPPQEASYPTYVDFQAAMRLLSLHKSRKRVKLLKRIRTRQDRYQLRTWGHHTGE